MEAKKISTEALMQVIAYLLHKGVLFVDIELENGEEADGVNIAFKKEYMDPRMVHHFEDIEVPSDKKEESDDIEITKLTDEDLQNLL